MVFLNHKKKYDNFCENSHFFEIHGQNWGVRGGRNWFKKTKFFLFFQPSSMCTILPQVSLAYHYYLKSYGMWMLKLLKRHHLFCFFQKKIFGKKKSSQKKNLRKKKIFAKKKSSHLDFFLSLHYSLTFPT